MRCAKVLQGKSNLAPESLPPPVPPRPAAGGGGEFLSHGLTDATSNCGRPIAAVDCAPHGRTNGNVTATIATAAPNPAVLSGGHLRPPNTLIVFCIAEAFPGRRTQPKGECTSETSSAGRKVCNSHFWSGAKRRVIRSGARSWDRASWRAARECNKRLRQQAARTPARRQMQTGRKDSRRKAQPKEFSTPPHRRRFR